MRAIAKALDEFVNSFNIPAYTPETVPEEVDVPYLIYPIKEPEWNQKTNWDIQGWYRSTSYAELTAKADEIHLLEQDNPYKPKGGRPAHSGREMKMSSAVSEIDLRGMDAVEAICVLDRYLDEAMRSNLSSVRIIHGKGTGVLRSAVQQSLRKSKFIKKFRLGVYGEGEDGVTIAEFV